MIELPTCPDFRVDGKRALVTGGSSGIGLAAATALGRAGAHVTLAARRSAELGNACAALRDSQISCDFVVLDVTQSADVDAAIANALPYDILVNNAGMNRPVPLIEQNDDEIDQVFEVNVKAAFYTSRAVARRLLAANRPGSIINISSQMGHVGSPGRVLYCASKHAMEGMTKALAWELGAKNIRVNSICPTFIETPMTAAMFDKPGFRQWVCERIALGRLGRVDEVMGAVVFLASSASSLMTGSALMLDGGWTAA
ncbi:3-oxoacyl-ACP reductase [Advenella sp. S44]|uniref:SDR family NAD(P)-dependent oxidoreductase n=1 Tax=Advenella sp. S44 TaxID=1982755 RepID=UPI000C2AFB57|nr:SDR family NAD(P)-dependent oxidoreductase [Advenella sp. S44]PJX26109.1 3-oxoacyl-ACP reductase [Advenella sp. S44]